MSPVQICAVIPTRHRNEWLARCLDQLAPGRQTLAPDLYQVIVTDDGSTSTAEAMIRDRYPWAQWVAGPCRGPAANRNNGARLVKSPWIAFTDDDCIPSPGWLAAFLAEATHERDVLEGRTVCRQGLPSILYEVPLNETGGVLWGCNLAVRKELFDRLGGFNEDFPFWCEDMEFQSRIRRAGVHEFFVAAAEVDHPPRRRSLFLAAARNWEARVHLESVMRASSTDGKALPPHVLKVRVREILDKPKTFGSAVALASALFETMYVAAQVGRWRRKYPWSSG